MNESVHPELKEHMNALCREMFEKLAENYTDDYSELLVMWQEVHNAYLETASGFLGQWAEKYDAASVEQVIDKLEADKIVVELVDKGTGKLFRRSLPIKYLETDNGLVLSGETMDGHPSQIAFLSDTALARVTDVFGEGPNTHRCE